MLDGLESREMYNNMFAVVHKERKTLKHVESFENRDPLVVYWH